MLRASAEDQSRNDVRPYPQEELLIEQLGELSAERILCTSAGMGQFALAAAVRFPQAKVYCHYHDLYHAQQGRQAMADAPGNVTIGCAADFPEEAIDLAAFPFSARGEAEFTRDLMQAAHQLLAAGGHLIVSTDNPRDKWLHEEMQKLFRKVVRRPADTGVVYLGRKQEPLKKVKQFAAEFVFQDQGRLIRACSRPGVFSHRRIDPGARQLMNAMQIGEGCRVLDIGCGAGVLSLAAALRAPRVEVQAIDSAARAVECTARGAELNGLTSIHSRLNAAGEVDEPNSFDLVLGNPPYYAAFQIARLFARAGHAALRPGGQMLMVTKSPEWYAENLPEWFGEVAITPSKDYHIVRAVKGT